MCYISREHLEGLKSTCPRPPANTNAFFCKRENTQRRGEWRIKHVADMSPSEKNGQRTSRPWTQFTMREHPQSEYVPTHRLVRSLFHITKWQRTFRPPESQNRKNSNLWHHEIREQSHPLTGVRGCPSSAAQLYIKIPIKICSFVHLIHSSISWIES